jgi:hypothetical protein
MRFKVTHAHTRTHTHTHIPHTRGVVNVNGLLTGWGHQLNRAVHQIHDSKKKRENW